MPLVHDRCICLRRSEYSETSQILLLFGRGQGMVRVIAKGAHRTTKAGASRFGGGIDLLDVGDAVFTHDPQKEMGILTEWKLREGNLGLRRTLRGMYLGLYAAELAAALMQEHDPHADLFDRLEEALGELAGDRVEESFLVLELELLREMGYPVDWSGCVICGAACGGEQGVGSVYFSGARGGLVCRACEPAAPDRVAVDPRLPGVVRLLQRLPRTNGGRPQRLPRLTRHQTDPINALLAMHVQYTLGRRLRMPRHVIGRGR